MDNKQVIVICGPTASGKTDIASRLCELINGEIISADSNPQVCRTRSRLSKAETEPLPLPPAKQIPIAGLPGVAAKPPGSLGLCRVFIKLIRSTPTSAVAAASTR